MKRSSRRPREVYRVYAEDELHADADAGAAGEELGAPDSLPVGAPRRHPALKAFGAAVLACVCGVIVGLVAVRLIDGAAVGGSALPDQHASRIAQPPVAAPGVVTASPLQRHASTRGPRRGTRLGGRSSRRVPRERLGPGPGADAGMALGRAPAVTPGPPSTVPTGAELPSTEGSGIAVTEDNAASSAGQGTEIEFGFER